MKNITVIFLAFLSFFTTVFSQDRGCFSVSLGANVPKGVYALTDFKSEDATLAKTGLFVNITMDNKLGKYLGIHSMINYGGNPIDENYVLSEFNSEIPQFTWSVDSRPWKLFGIMFGPNSNIPLIKEKLSLDVRALLGVTKVSSSYLYVSGYYERTFVWAKKERVSATSLSFQLGSGLKYNVNGATSLMLNINYFGCAPNFLDLPTSYSDGSKYYRSFKQKVRTINLGLGVGYRL